MSFGDAAPKIMNIRPGTVVLVCNPKMMPKKENNDHGHSFCVDGEA